MAKRTFTVETVKGWGGTNYMVRITGTGRYAADASGHAFISSRKGSAQRWADKCNERGHCGKDRKAA